MKILIIGAGISGVTAGHILAEKNIEFEILEASSVHGGRLKKIDGFADFPIDLGAEWVHKWIKAQPPLMESLLAGENPNFKTFKYRPKTYGLWALGRLWNFNFMKFLPTLDDNKFVSSSWFDFLDELVTADLKEKIRYNSPVNKIEYANENVVLTTTSGEEYTADKVLITVPIKMLQQGYINFAPVLPEEKVKAIHKEQMPDGLKLFIEFSECFYPNVLFMDSVFYSLRNNYLYYDAALGKNSSKNILGLLVDGKKAIQYSSLENDEAIISYVLSQLDEIFDGQATKYYIKHVIQDWSKEAFIQGTYSRRKASAQTLSSPIANKLYFAGEAMNPNGKTVAVHGASESAYLMLDKMLEDV